MGYDSPVLTLEFGPIPTYQDCIEAIISEIGTTALIPKRILRSGPATIVFWQDETKTIVKRAPDDPDNSYSAFTAALAIKIFGSNSALKKLVKEKTEVAE